MKIHATYSLLMTTALAGLVTPVFAQEIQTSNGTAILLDEIVLRGDKVGRTIQSATAGTTVINGETANAAVNQDIDDVVAAEANVLANEGFSLPSIRGIDSTSGGRPSITAGSQPRTPILVDGVALPSNESSAISSVSTWDIDTVEVGRGPQPTNTGRNAIGGAIRVFTNDPTYDLEFATRIGYFNQNGTINGAALVNIPIVEDQAALRFTAEGSFGDSFVDIVPSVPAGFDPNQETFGRVKGKLLLEPSSLPGLSVLVSVDHLRNEEPIDGFVDDVEAVSISGANPFGLVSSFEEVDQTVYQARASYDFDERFTLVSRVAYLDNSLLFADTGDVFNFGFPFALGATGFDKDQIEGEVYLQFRDLGVIRRGVFGVIHNTEKEDGFNSGTLEFTADGEINNTGVYGEVEVSADRFVDGLTFIGGGRLEIDNRFRDTFAPAGNPVGAFYGSETEFLPKAGIRYEPTDNLTFGYTFSRGFRAGGLDVDLTAPIFGLPLSISEFGSEFINQHEVYARGSFLDGKLDLSATGFYYKWDDAQVEGAASFFGGGVVLIGNVPEAIGFGGEFNAAYKINQQFSVKAALGLLETEITDAGTGLATFEGSALPRAPELTISGGLTWQPMENLKAAVDVRHIGETFTGLGEATLDNYTVVDVSAGYTVRTGSSEFQLEGFVNNIFDESFITFSEAGFITLTAVGRPRTFGALLTAKF
ncbi:MAG: TonB-dependent receptor [Pseudomonadota bacterium]